MGERTQNTEQGPLQPGTGNAIPLFPSLWSPDHGRKVATSPPTRGGLDNFRQKASHGTGAEEAAEDRTRGRRQPRPLQTPTATQRRRVCSLRTTSAASGTATSQPCGDGWGPGRPGLALDTELAQGQPAVITFIPGHSSRGLTGRLLDSKHRRCPDLLISGERRATKGPGRVSRSGKGRGARGL